MRKVKNHYYQIVVDKNYGEHDLRGVPVGEKYTNEQEAEKALENYPKEYYLSEVTQYCR